MESTQAGRQFLHPNSSEWNPKFSTRQDLNYECENLRWVEVLAGPETEDNDETDVDPGEESVIRKFMHGPDDPDVCSPQADKVGSICEGATLELLQRDKPEGDETERLVALLLERSVTFGERKGRPRQYRGPLTARTLYRDLKKLRFRVNECKQEAGYQSSPSHELKENNEHDHKEPDSERQLVFITDLDRWSICALVGTVSKYDASALRDALYKHVAFESFIGVILPPKGFPMFQFAVHLPYFVWRRKECQDHRRDANGSPLRRTQNVSFLNWKSSESSGFLYEANISCVVSGRDQDRWLAYCFVDSYFDAPEEGRESVLSYHEDSLGEHGALMDPLTKGSSSEDQPIERPREYFLVVLLNRLGQVQREWQQVVAKVEQSIREYEESHSYLVYSSNELPSSEAEERAEKIWKSHNFVIKSRDLSTRLFYSLSKTVDACERFCRQDADYFRIPSASDDTHQPLNSLPTIQITFDKLFKMKKALEFTTGRYEQFAKDLELQLNFRNDELGRRNNELSLKTIELAHLQHKVSKDNKGLSVVMMLSVTPIAVTAAVLSLGKDIIPFIPRNFGSFIGLTIITFVVLGALIHTVRPLWDWQLFSGWVGHKRWDQKLREWRSSKLWITREHSPLEEV